MEVVDHHGKKIVVIFWGLLRSLLYYSFTTDGGFKWIIFTIVILFSNIFGIGYLQKWDPSQK
jgi:hypothetical protein